MHLTCHPAVRVSPRISAMLHKPENASHGPRSCYRKASNRARRVIRNAQSQRSISGWLILWDASGFLAPRAFVPPPHECHRASNVFSESISIEAMCLFDLQEEPVFGQPMHAVVKSWVISKSTLLESGGEDLRQGLADARSSRVGHLKTPCFIKTEIKRSQVGSSPGLYRLARSSPAQQVLVALVVLPDEAVEAYGVIAR